MDELEEAAVLHGLALNLSIPMSSRLGCALKALAIYEKMLEEK